MKNNEKTRLTTCEGCGRLGQDDLDANEEVEPLFTPGYEAAKEPGADDPEWIKYRKGMQEMNIPVTISYKDFIKRYFNGEDDDDTVVGRRIR